MGLCSWLDLLYSRLLLGLGLLLWKTLLQEKVILVLNEGLASESLLEDFLSGDAVRDFLLDVVLHVLSNPVLVHLLQVGSVVSYPVLLVVLLVDELVVF